MDEDSHFCVLEKLEVAYLIGNEKRKVSLELSRRHCYYIVSDNIPKYQHENERSMQERYAHMRYPYKPLMMKGRWRIKSAEDISYYLNVIDRQLGRINLHEVAKYSVIDMGNR
jgi:hypothetical protein